MDKLILGLLILKRLTVYELRNIIKHYFQSMCSDSLGSIRAAVNKLFDSGLITCNAYVERNVNKKQYAITDKGRKAFLEWVHTPADLSTPKNIELAKFYSMGFLTPDKRVQALNEIITTLQGTLSKLTCIKNSIDVQEGQAQIVEYWESDPEYKDGIKWATENTDIKHAARILGDFQMQCLQYDIDVTQFQIDWFTKLRDRGYKNESSEK